MKPPRLNWVVLCFAALVVTTITGCFVQSFQPFYTEAAKIAFPQVVGEWDLQRAMGMDIGIQARGPCTFSAAAGTGYLLEAGPPGDVAADFRAVFFKVGHWTYCDLKVLEVGNPTNLNTFSMFSLANLCPVHTVYQVDLKGDNLNLKPLDYHWFTNALQQKQIKLPFLEQRDTSALSLVPFFSGPLFTATPEQWREVLAKCGSDTNAFSAANALVLTRHTIPAAVATSSPGAAPDGAPGAGSTYSEATPITHGQFIRELKEVDLTVDMEPWITKYVSEAEVRRELSSALSGYGIAVRAGAPVSCLVTLDQLGAVASKTKFYTDGRKEVEEVHSHVFNYSVGFYVRAVALRNGKLHEVIAAPARGDGNFYIEENNPVRRLVFGDETASDIRKGLVEAFPQTLRSLAADTTPDPIPWPPAGWSQTQRADADAAYTALINNPSAVERQPIQGLDVVPYFDLSDNRRGEDCAVESSWTNLWPAEFRQFGWVNSHSGSFLILQEIPYCEYQDSGPVGYYPLGDDLMLSESNLVFELNGRRVRESGVIFAAHRLKVAREDEMPDTLRTFLVDGVSLFAARLMVGDQILPAVR